MAGALALTTQAPFLFKVKVFPIKEQFLFLVTEYLTFSPKFEVAGSAIFEPALPDVVNATL